MSRTCKSLFFLFLLFVCSAVSVLAQSAQLTGARKLITKASPNYPSMARSLNLTGSVKLEALVNPNGSVKAVQIRGGNPVLAQAAENAVRGWKWEKSDRETTELVEIKFTP